MHITTNRFCCVLSRLACSTAGLVSKNGHFLAVFRTIVLKVQDDRRYAKQVFPMRAVVLLWRLGYEMLANGCSIRRVPETWLILR